MLALTGHKADGWMPSYNHLGLDRLEQAITHIDTAAREADRDPATLRKIYNLNGIIDRESSEPFHGSTQQWIEQLTSLVEDYGMNGFVYWPNADHQLQLARFARDVVPAVKEALADTGDL